MSRTLFQVRTTSAYLVWAAFGCDTDCDVCALWWTVVDCGMADCGADEASVFARTPAGTPRSREPEH